MNKEYARKYQREYYRKNKLFISERANECLQKRLSLLTDEERKDYWKKRWLYIKKYRIKRKIKINKFKGEKGCLDCGIKDWRVLDFDHVKGKKIASVNELFRNNVSRKRLLSEIKKCVIRCANCHRIKTYERRILKVVNKNK